MGKRAVSGTKEWAAVSANCMIGCAHSCLYCYAKANAIRFSKATPESWADEKFGILPTSRKHKGTVMFPTAHDITAGNWEHCLEALKKLLSTGNKVLVVSKPSQRILVDLCEGLKKTGRLLEWRPNILFRFTIGSMDPGTLAFWEPNAPTFAERLCSLMWAFKNGWKTSVSMEPMLDDNLDDVIKLVRTVAPYVTDAVWIGKANKLRQRCSMNAGGKLDAHVDMMVLRLEAAWTDARIKDLYYRNINCDPELSLKVKWKESIKKVIGLEIPVEAGLDV